MVVVMLVVDRVGNGSGHVGGKGWEIVVRMVDQVVVNKVGNDSTHVRGQG